MTFRERPKTQLASFLVLINREFQYQKRHVLLSKRKNTGHYDGFYSLPAGRVELGETIKECIIREAKEEIDITLKDSHLKLAHVMHIKENGNDYESIYFYFTIDHSYIHSQIPKNVEPDKCEELKWESVYNIPKNTIPYVKQALNHIFQKESINYSETVEIE